MRMHGPQVLVCGRDSSFRVLLFIMKAVMGERGHFCQVLLICAFPMALNTSTHLKPLNLVCVLRLVTMDQFGDPPAFCAGVIWGMI